MGVKSILVVLGVIFGILMAAIKSEGVSNKPLPSVPKAYADRHMPKGWWTDPAVLAEGKKIFETLEIKDKKGEINKNGCSNCHGKEGKPKKRGPRDMTSAKVINRFSDSYWFWRISEGVPRTKMQSFKQLLKEEQIWQLMAYEHAFSHQGKPAVHDHPEIEVSVASQ